MKLRKWSLVAALAAVMLTAGVFAGVAFAGGATPSNGTVRQSAASPDFSTSTAVKVKAAAVVNSDGTLLRGSTLTYHVSQILHLGTGTYDLRFSHSIAGCAWVGSIGFGGFAGSTGPAEISLSGRAGTNNGLFVQTFSADSPADLPFHVIVVC